MAALRKRIAELAMIAVRFDVTSRGACLAHAVVGGATEEETAGAGRAGLAVGVLARGGILGLGSHNAGGGGDRFPVVRVVARHAEAIAGINVRSILVARAPQIVLDGPVLRFVVRQVIVAARVQGPAFLDRHQSAARGRAVAAQGERRRVGHVVVVVAAAVTRSATEVAVAGVERRQGVGVFELPVEELAVAHLAHRCGVPRGVDIVQAGEFLMVVVVGVSAAGVEEVVAVIGQRDAAVLLHNLMSRVGVDASIKVTFPSGTSQLSQQAILSRGEARLERPIDVGPSWYARHPCADGGRTDNTHRKRVADSTKQ